MRGCTVEQFSTQQEHAVPHVDCPVCERAREVILCRITPELPFTEAAAMWLESRTLSTAARKKARIIKKTTEDSYMRYIASLGLFFSGLKLNEIHLGYLRQYQEARLVGAGPWFIRYRRPQDAKPKRLKDGTELPPKGKISCPVQPKKVNQELSILTMILKRAGCWTEEMEEYYEELAEDEGELRRIPTPPEQSRWLAISASRSEWAVVYWYSVAAFDTTLGTNEMRSLRIGDVNIPHRTVSVPAAGAKNPYRKRTVTIDSAEALDAFSNLLRRAADLGSVDPLHHLFPFRKPGSYARFAGETSDFDPTKSMTVTGLRKPWEAVRQAAHMDWFAMTDTRPTALTRMAENGVSPEIMRAKAGHVDDRMMRHYVRIYEGAIRKAMQAVPSFGPSKEKAPVYVMKRRA